jgi:predicted GNAT family N-acyltransferase
MSLIINKIATETDLREAFAVRYDVFVLEQQVPEVMELDEFERSSTHYLARWQGETAGTCRWRRTEKGIKLERFAVRKPLRERGIAAALVQTALAELATEPLIYLHAQITAVGFYEKYGFVKKGEPFDEAGIVHYVMHLEKRI